VYEYRLFVEPRRGRSAVQRVIHKHRLDLTFDPQIIVLPRYTEILTIQIQRDEIVLWEAHDIDRVGTDKRVLVIRPTGAIFKANSDDIYLGSFQMDEGRFVGHVFEIVEND
jgi:hypothetical protein